MKKYILNPAYYLRNDLKRSIIGAYDDPIPVCDNHDRNFVYITHPTIAKILSFFQGSDTLDKTILMASQTLDIDKEFVAAFVNSVCDNEFPVMNEYDGCKLLLPKKVLVSGNFGDRTEHYAYNEFDIEGEIDLCNNRLYKPTKIILELTMKCYTKCVYCYADKRTKYVPLSSERIISIINEAHELGIPSIELNGGEVLLHPDIKEILIALDKHGYHPFISTKVPLDTDMLLFLMEHNFKNIQISLDSVNPNTLSTTLGVTKPYLDKLDHTMKYIDDHDFLWQVNVVVTRFNSSLTTEFEPLMGYLKSFKNLRGIKVVPAAFSMYQSHENFERIKADTVHINAIRNYIHYLNTERFFNFTIIYDEPECQLMYEQDNKRNRFETRAYCTANQRAFNILPDGKATICEELYWHPRFIIGDLTASSIEEVWNSTKAQNLFHITQNLISNESKCSICQIFDTCRPLGRVCWKLVLLAYGHENWDYPDPRCPEADYPYTNFLY